MVGEATPAQALVNSAVDQIIDAMSEEALTSTRARQPSMFDVTSIEQSAHDASVLAIVIPYYKKRYFGELLRSLELQSDRNFKVYIGDDNSPEDPQELLSQMTQRLRFYYRRFETRIGHHSLAEQWNRCLQLTRGEQWVWVIPDDDLLSENCVEEFYKALRSGRLDNVNVLTIPTITLDETGRPKSRAVINPMVQDNYQFYMRQLKGQATGSSLGDNIFRLQTLMSIGGFVDFARGTHSDHATIISASAGSMIYCLQDATFFFRQSGLNISSQTHDMQQKMSAKLDFARWLKRNESKFRQKLESEFYLYLYWKGEHYVLNEWPLDWRVLALLYRLRVFCTGSRNPLPIISITARKFYRMLVPTIIKGQI